MCAHLGMAGVHRVLQRAWGGEYPRQLCGGLRASGWADGLWLPPDHRQQDPTGVRHLNLSFQSLDLLMFIDWSSKTMTCNNS